MRKTKTRVGSAQTERDSKEEQEVELTRNNVARIHGILIFDEAEAIHELDLRDLAGAMGTEVSLDLGLGDFEWEERVSVAVQKKHLSLGP